MNKLTSALALFLLTGCLSIQNNIGAEVSNEQVSKLIINKTTYNEVLTTLGAPVVLKNTIENSKPVIKVFYKRKKGESYVTGFLPSNIEFSILPIKGEMKDSIVLVFSDNILISKQFLD